MQISSKLVINCFKADRIQFSKMAFVLRNQQTHVFKTTGRYTKSSWQKPQNETCLNKGNIIAKVRDDRKQVRKSNTQVHIYPLSGIWEGWCPWKEKCSQATVTTREHGITQAKSLQKRLPDLCYRGKFEPTFWDIQVYRWTQKLFWHVANQA